MPRIILALPLVFTAALVAAGACTAPARNGATTERPHDYASGRLALRIPGGGHGGPRGLSNLGLGTARDGEIWVPSQYTEARPTPLLVMLHGAGGTARRAMQLVQPFADSAGFIVLALESRGTTWDFIRGPFGPDVARLDSAIARVSARYNVDPAHVAIAGFSDGASYALSLGLHNGDVFERIVAFSPGLATTFDPRGRPRIWISHGRADSILPIDRTSRRIAAQLVDAGYDVTYREFDGPHAVPPDVAREAIGWLSGSR